MRQHGRSKCPVPSDPPAAAAAPVSPEMVIETLSAPAVGVGLLTPREVRHYKVALQVALGPICKMQVAAEFLSVLKSRTVNLAAGLRKMR
jgi:hypothetical protein